MAHTRPRAISESENPTGRQAAHRRRPTRGRALLAVLWLLAPMPGLCAEEPASASDAAPTLELIDGRWFDGRGFRRQSFYSVAGKLTHTRPEQIDKVVDLDGGYLVPPFGEGHNHNIEKFYNLEKQIRSYLEGGIYYVKIANSIRELNLKIRGRLNTPQSIDVAFANGGLTASGGHPIKLYEEILREKAYRGVAKEWFEDRSYYVIDDGEDLERKWPAIRSEPPDFIKVFLLYSEEFEKRRDDPSYFGRKGLDPRLLPKVVEKAHAGGLRVAAHVETATDFHHALHAGVDEITHLPGYNIPSSREVAAYQISEEDARLAGERGLVVVTTTLLSKLRVKDPERLRRIQDNQRRNLKLLHGHGARISIGMDHYASTAVEEALHLHEMGIFDNQTLLGLWCETTPRAIFPRRRIGRLEEGYEASFLVLRGNPIEDFENVRSIRLRFKQGELLMLEKTAVEGGD